MSRMFHIGPTADAESLPYLRGGTPLNDLAFFGAQFVKVGGSVLYTAQNGVNLAGGGGTITALTEEYYRFKIRIRRLPLQTTTMFSINSTLEGQAGVLIACSSAGEIRAYNQGNQAVYAQLIGNVGTPTVGEWNEYFLYVRYRQLATPGHLTLQRMEGGGTTTLDWVAGTSGFGLELIQQTRTCSIGGIGGASGGNDGMDFDFCDLVGDSTTDPGATRISYLRTAADGVYQEYTAAGMADWRARWMFPYATVAGAAIYPVRTNTIGKKQSYVMQSFVSQGISGTINSACLHCFVGATGAATAPTLIIRRINSGGSATETLVTLYTVGAGTWLNFRIDDAVNWSTTDTIEIGIINNSGGGMSIGALCLSIEHSTLYTAPTDTDFSCVLTQWTGNGSVQTVQAPNGLTPDFIWWMPATSIAPGGFWHRSMGSAQWFTNFGPTRPHLQVDGNNIYLIGNETASPNVNGRVYDVLIVSDPTRRMVSPYSQIQSTNSNWDNNDVPIFDGEGNPFAPTFAMGVNESPLTSVSGYMRGPGQTGDSSGFLIGGSSPVNDVFQAFNTDGLELGVRFPGVASTGQFAFGAFRSDFFGSSFFSLSSYTGNGSNPRTVTLNMPSYTPSWVVVFTLTSTGGRNTQISTPTTVASRNINDGTAQTDSITAVGNNSITIGTGLNQNGFTYVVFAIAAGVDAEPSPEPAPGPYPGPPLPTMDPVPSTTNATLLTLRRLRRFPHLSDEEFRLFYHRLLIDMEMGVGLSGDEQVGSAPQLMIRWSDDGGMTWSAEHWVPVGRIGQYGVRAIINRLGQGRDRVFELVVTDPVAWRFVDAYLELAKGNS